MSFKPNLIIILLFSFSMSSLASKDSSDFRYPFFNQKVDKKKRKREAERERREAIIAMHNLIYGSTKLKGKKAIDNEKTTAGLIQEVEYMRAHPDDFNVDVIQAKEELLDDAKSELARLMSSSKGDGKPDSVFSSAIMLGFLDADMLEFLDDHDLLYTAKNDPNGWHDLKNIRTAILAKSAVSLSKTTDKIVTESIGTSLESGARNVSSSVGSVLKDAWVKLMRAIYGVSGDPFDYLKVEDFGNFTCDMVKNLQEVCKSAGRLGNRELISRAKTIEMPEAIIKLDALFVKYTGEHVKKYTKLSELEVTPEIMSAIESSFDVEISPSEFDKFETISDIVSFIQVDADWREERDNRLADILSVIAYFENCLQYYEKNQDSMEYRYGKMINNILYELVSILNKAQSDKDFGADTLQRRLKRLHRSLDIAVKSLLRHIPGGNVSSSKVDKVESKPRKRHRMMDDDFYDS